MDTLMFQFKLSVTLGETEQALNLYQDIISQTDQYDLDDIIIVEKLSKNLIQNFKKEIEPLIKIKCHNSSKYSKNKSKKSKSKHLKEKEKEANNPIEDENSEMHSIFNSTRPTILKESETESQNEKKSTKKDIKNFDIENLDDKENKDNNNDIDNINEEDDVNVLQLYIKHIVDKNIFLLQQLMSSIDYIRPKLKNTKDLTSLALLNKISGKLYLTLFKYQDREKSLMLEKAIQYFQKIVTVFLNPKNDAMIREEESDIVIWYKIILSYCKFLIKGVKDYLRPMLICNSMIERIKKEKTNYIDDQGLLNDLDNILEKYEDFRNKYSDEGKKVVRVYNPEMKNL